LVVSFWPFKWSGLPGLTARRGGRRTDNRHEPESTAFSRSFATPKQSLQQACGDLEVQFLAISLGLESLSQSGDRFVAQVEKLVGVATGKNCDNLVFSSAIQ